MRVAVLPDIHGNVDALEAVLDDLARVSPDLVVNLGDCVSGPLDAGAAAERLMALGWPTVRGNHDRQVATLERTAMGASDRAAFDQLTPEQVAWHAALPATIEPIPGVLLCHGCPDHDDRYLTEAVCGDATMLADRREITANLAGARSELVLYGHSHVPRLLRLPSGPILLNPGSVGLQAYRDETPPHRVEVGSPHARYAIMDRRGSEWHFAHRAVAYDWDAAARKAGQAGRPDWAVALRTGRASED